MPPFRRNIPLHVAGMVGREGGRSVYDDFATGGWFSNKSPDPGGSGLSTIARAMAPAWPPSGPRDHLWTPDEHMYSPLSHELVKEPVFPSASCRLTCRTDKQRGGVVKASALVGSLALANAELG